jgi:hypothetical protein
MSVTAAIESWSGNPLDVGPLYPWVGGELLLLIICVALWICWTIWQIKTENAGYAKEVQELKQQGLSRFVGGK